MPKPLIIGIDIRDLKKSKTGTWTYLNEVCRQFRLMEGETYKFHFFDTWLPVYTGEDKLLKWIEHIRYQFWKQLVLPVKATLKHCDIVFCTDNVVPYIHLGYKTIPVFHDAFFFENPEHYNSIWLWVYKKTAIPAAKRSPYVITPTNYARERIHHYTAIDLNKLKVIYEGPKSLNEIKKQNQSSHQILSDYHFEKKKYVLHVGIMDKRKNIPALIYAFKKFKESGYDSFKLVLAGKAVAKKYSNNFDNIRKAIETCELEDEVIITGYLSDEDLSKVYAGAFMYVFPSLNEGFGIPILEAFYYRLPVLAADNTCLPEVGGDAILTFNPFDTEDIFLKMKMLADNEMLRNDLIEKGRKRLKQFSWEMTAKKLVEVFSSANLNA